MTEKPSLTRPGLRKIKVDLTDPSLRAVYLQGETIGYLAALPLMRRLSLANIEVVLAHSTPWSNLIYVFPDSPSELWADLVRETAADILVLGHTHVPMCKQVADTWIVNPGSVYENRWEERRTCAILETCPFLFTLYDIDSGQIVQF